LSALDGLLDSGLIKGLAHITGGGLTDNIPRILPAGCAVQIERGSWPVLPVFKLMQQLGNVAEAEMYRTFNLGVGMVIVSAPQDQQTIVTRLADRTPCFEIGRVVPGDRVVTFS